MFNSCSVFLLWDYKIIFIIPIFLLTNTRNNDIINIQGDDNMEEKKKKKRIKGSTIGWMAFWLFLLALVGRFLVVMIGCLITIIFYAVSWGVGNIDEDVRQYEFNIYAMKDNITYIQTRNSGESQLRYYFSRNLNGGKHVGWVSAENATIIEDNENKVIVYANEPKFGKGFWKWSIDTLWDGGYPIDKKYEIHVPPNSVTNDYTIDLE